MTLRITEDGSYTAHSSRYAQTYHSIHGAVTEARHVFLDATNIRHGFEKRLDTHVLEIGFGLGLNALLTADLALSVPAKNRPNLSYHAFEHDLIDASYFEALEYGAVLKHPQLAAAMTAMLRDIHAHRHTYENTQKTSAPHIATHSVELARGCNLTLHLEDAAAPDCGFFTMDKPAGYRKAFNAIYLDAFCPEANAECWTPEFVARLAGVLSDDGILSTYSAKGRVRRAMLAAGLQVQKRPGPPGKREMLLAHR